MNIKEVEYSEWCHSCAHREEYETEDPCNECLTQPWNEDSHKPIKYKEAENE